LLRRNASKRVVFNVAQFTLAVTTAAAVYRAFGGSVPPIYLAADRAVDAQAVQKELLLFFVYAASYFLVNSVSVSGVIALSSDRSFREVWNVNARGVLGYDLGASAIALFIAWLYVRFEQWLGVGFGSVGPLVGVLPVIAIRHVYGLYHQLQESGQELLQVMVKAIEARDPYTSGHSLRVSRLSRAIAASLGLPPREIEQVETAALLHDVGKIHEEFAPLLRKESKLTAEETALMQTHAVRSAELVSIISKFRGAIHDAVRHHHERWDGQGYPDGLATDGIPLASRIILISDTVDAMTTDRPYRKRLPLETVMVELQRCRGTQFDPAIVDVVVSSVAVRRIIGHGLAAPEESIPGQRASWPGSRFWKTRKAQS
jgi:putative nucleotidyltransferase with HDIG domain